METGRQTNEEGENRTRRKIEIEDEGGRRSKGEGRVRKRNEGRENADGQH